MVYALIITKKPPHLTPAWVLSGGGRGYIITYFFFFFLPPQGIMTSFIFHYTMSILYRTTVSQWYRQWYSQDTERPFSSSHENGNKKPPYPLPLPLSGAMGFIGGLLLIMPVMTAPANHTHYSVIRAFDTTLKPLFCLDWHFNYSTICLSIRATKLQYEHQT